MNLKKEEKQTSGNTGFVNYQEPISIRVGEWLRNQGYILASCLGIVLDSLRETDSLGILWENPKAKGRKILFGLIKLKPRRKFVGTIWFNNRPRGANEKNWVFEVYGKENIEQVKQLAEKMVSTFKVKISLRLVSEESEFERYPSDFDW